MGKDEKAIKEATDHLTHAAGNFYINDKPTGAVVGQQPFGGSRASGTNDKAGSKYFLTRFGNNVITKFNLKYLLDFHMKVNSDATMAVIENETKLPFGVVKTKIPLSSSKSYKSSKSFKISSSVKCSINSIDVITSNFLLKFSCWICEVLKKSKFVPYFFFAKLI